MNNEELEREKYLNNRFGFYNDKTTEELETILDKLTVERDEDEQIYETTTNGNLKNDLNADLNFENEEISYIEKLLKERKGGSR